jgi:hypothetical protein
VDLQEAADLAVALMDRWGLEGWRLQFDRARRRFGYCNHRQRTISLSRHLVGLNGREAVRDTILHEIAHALLPPRHGHDAVWRAKAREVGAAPRRSYGEEVAQPPSRWVGTCPGCGGQVGLHRRPRRSHSCWPCGGGRFDARFILSWKDAGP